MGGIGFGVGFVGAMEPGLGVVTGGLVVGLVGGFVGAIGMLLPRQIKLN